MEDNGARACLWTWGWGEFGRLGHGDTLSQLEPKPLAHESLNGAIYVACGGHHTVAVTEDGEVVSWGWGNEGQLGSGNAFDQTVPAVVKALSNHRVCGVACGYYHTAVVTDVGLVMCWGKGNSGQLGQGDWTSSLLPRTVSTLYNEKIRQIACGMAHTLALSVNGEIYSWGAGADGQLGVGKHQEETADVATPQKVRVDEEEKFEFIACGSRHCMAITDDCRLFSWGLGADGRLGLGDSESRFSPTVVRRSIENLRICYVAAGGHHTAVLSDNGEIFTCGRGSYGQLGHGDADPQLTLKKIVQLRDKKIIKAACGDTHTLVISTAGEVFAWGAAEDGQLGTGGTEGANSPVELTSLRGLVGDVSCGLVHSAAVPMQIFAVSSKIAELEDVIQRLSTSLRTAEMQVQAERRSRLVAEHKLQEAMHLLSKRGAVHKVVHGSEATGNGEEEHRNHAVRHEAPPMVDACVQTEGYLLYPRKSYAKSSVATAEPVAPPAGNQDDRASSRQGEGERKKERESEKEGERKKTGEGPTETESFKRDGLLRRAQQIQQETMGKNSTHNASEMRELQLSFLEDVRCGGSITTSSMGSESDSILELELECDESLKDTYQLQHDVLPEYYLPQSGGGPAGVLAGKGERHVLEDGKTKHVGKQDLMEANSHAQAAGTSRLNSKTRQMFKISSKVKRGVTGFLKELKEELISDRPHDG